MITYQVEQGDEPWFQARAGKITASMYEECRKRLKSGPNKGGFTAAADKYARGLAVERISGEALQGNDFETFAMKRGHALEPIARALHEERTGLFIERAGFISTDCERFGASADGVIGDDGGSEYKCLVDADRVTKIVIDGDITEFMDQVQGCMMISGAKWWHFCLYCPALANINKDLTIFEVKRDENYIADLWADLIEFNELVDSYTERLKMATPGAMVIPAKREVAL